MKWIPLLILPLLASGCVTVTPGSLDALCQGTRDARVEHAVALAVSVDDRAVVTGARLIELVDAGCAK